MEDYKTPLGVQLKKSFLTGSSFICNPPVLDTDVDICILVENLADTCDILEADGWKVSSDDPEYQCEGSGEIDFITARKGGGGVSTNLIIYDDQRGYTAFQHATLVAKKLNVVDKLDRVLLFQAVCADRKHIADLDIFS